MPDGQLWASAAIVLTLLGRLIVLVVVVAGGRHAADIVGGGVGREPGIPGHGGVLRSGQSCCPAPVPVLCCPVWSKWQ